MKETVTTCYLEMNRPSEFRPSGGYKELVELKRISEDIFQQWMLFVGIGLPWRWYSRLKWSPADWEEYFRKNNVLTYLAFGKNSLVGYFELVSGENNAFEIRFFGLFPSSIGKGFGGALLSHAVEVAWNSGAEKVWLHTCTSDHEAALTNYMARGFKLVKESAEEEIIPDKEEYLELVNNFISNYIDTLNKFRK